MQALPRPISNVTVPVRLETSEARVEIAPNLGASVLRYELSDGLAIFRPSPEMCTDPFATGCFLMVPWCNRIDGGVTAHAEFVAIERNREDQALPIHGSAATEQFEVTKAVANVAWLSTRVTGPAPFDYTVHVGYALEGAQLTVSLTVVHEGNGIVPYGLGLHPWFPRNGTVSLRAAASHYLETGPDMLPIRDVDVAHKPDWNFNQSGALPPNLIDTAFAGWDGHAQIRGEDGWGLSIVTDPPCGWYQVYSPDKDAGFFCFEPVTHPINAHNHPDHPGLVALARGESVTLTTRFIPV